MTYFLTKCTTLGRLSNTTLQKFSAKGGWGKPQILKLFVGKKNNLQRQKSNISTFLDYSPYLLFTYFCYFFIFFFIFFLILFQDLVRSEWGEVGQEGPWDSAAISLSLFTPCLLTLLLFYSFIFPLYLFLLLFLFCNSYRRKQKFWYPHNGKKHLGRSVR